MGQEEVILAAIYAVINMTISVLVGFILCKMDVLTAKTRGVVSSVNYYALVPLYGLMYVMQAIDRNNLKELGVVLFSAMSTVVVGFAVTLTVVFLMGADIRYRFAYSFVLVYQNIVVMPQMMADSLCDKGGKYETTRTCKSKLVKPYCALPFIYVNILYWVTVLPILQNEKRISNELRKVFIIVLNYYHKIDDFLQDSTFANMKQVHFDDKEVERAIAIANGKTPPPVPQVVTNLLPGKEGEGKIEHRGGELYQTDVALMMKDDKREMMTPMMLTDQRFINEYFERRIDGDDYDTIMRRFQEFEDKVFNTEEQKKNREDIIACVLSPNDLLKKGVIDDICTFDFYKQRILFSPPAVWSIIGVILGFIFPFKEWLFNPLNKPLPTFISTLQTIGGMMSPISMFLLGTYIAQSSVIAPDLFIRWKHIIVSNVVRNAILPVIGYLWINVFVKAMDEQIYQANPVLMFIIYTYWIVPNGIVLIAVYVVADYFAKEFAVISIYMNLISIPMMAIYLIVYFIIYES